MQGSAKGEIKITDECVCIKLHEASASVHPQLEKFTTEVVGIRFGLAYQADAEVWDIMGYAPVKSLGVLVSSNKPIELAPFETSMPLPDDLDSKKHWVLMEIVMKHSYENGFSYSYAHEEDGLK